MGFVAITCWKCKIQYGMPEDFYRIAKQMARNTTFYCPNGHSAAFTEGETDEDKMRRERDQALQKIAEKDDELRRAWATANQQSEFRKTAERAAATARGQVTRIKKRASAGICPCCNRHFTQLERHMHTKHPDFTKEPVEGAALH